MKERNHFYLYTVETRRVEDEEIKDDDGNPTGKTRKVTYWDQQLVPDCCDMHEVAGKLSRELNDVRYVNKVIQ